MKSIKLILLGVAVSGVIVVAGIFIFLETFDIDAYLPEVSRQASKVLGRPVMIGHAGLGVSPGGVTLNAGPVLIADDVAVSQEPFVTVQNLRLGLDIGSLILHRKIRITDVLLQSPVIHIILAKDGILNTQSIAGALSNLASGHPFAMLRAGSERSEGSHISTDSSPIRLRMTTGEVKSVSRVSAPALSVGSITIRDVSISFIDQNEALPPLDIRVADIHLSFNGCLTLTGGVIKNFNLIKTVLTYTLGVFPGLDYIDPLGSKDTRIEKAQVKFSVHERTFFIDEAFVETNIFGLTAKGSVDEGLNTDLQTILHLNSEISVGLVHKLGGLRRLMDDSQRITIPAEIKGVFPHLKYKPSKDFRKKSKKVLIEEGGNILNVLLGGR